VKAAETGARADEPLDRNTPPVTPSAFPAAEEDEGRQSGVFSVASVSVGLLMRPADVTDAVREAIRSRGLRVLEVTTPAEVKASAGARFAIVDVTLPGAVALLGWLTEPAQGSWVLAIVPPGVSPIAYVRAGARETLPAGFDPADLAFMLDRLREAGDVASEAREVLGRTSAHATAESSVRACAAMAHEIRNALTAAMGSTQILRDAASREHPRLSVDERDEITAEIADALTRINDIVTSVLSLARREAPALRTIDLLDVAQEAVATLPGNARRGIRVAGARGTLAMGHKGLLVQAVTNLIRNALDATEGSPHPRVLVRVYRTGTEARISVRDNGPGIPQEVRQRLFEPYFSTKGSAGTGVGLALSRQILASMGGALTLSGEPPPGACFRVRLELASRG
jgi:signal transduction histidine kinase